MAENYIVCGYTPWSKKVFKEKISKLKGKWFLISDKTNLTLQKVEKINPRYIFFLHWSWLVAEDIIENYECVCFHMTDVPFGRGGSPLQNLIVRGHKSTKLTALRMTDKFDAGPVYLKKPMSLAGRAQQVYKRAMDLSCEMIKEIIIKNPKPKEQKGKAVIFKRRTPQQSEIPQLKNLQGFYDFIRMLDADGYPKAFLKYKGFLLEFSAAELNKGELKAKVVIKKDGKQK